MHGRPAGYNIIEYKAHNSLPMCDGLWFHGCLRCVKIGSRCLSASRMKKKKHDNTAHPYPFLSRAIPLR